MKRNPSIIGSLILWFLLCFLTSAAMAHENCTQAGCAGEPYNDMPRIASIGERTGKYFDIPDFAKGPAVDAAKGYRLQDLGNGLYMVTNNIYQSMFLVYETGVVVMDAPPSLASIILPAIAEVSRKPVTHIIYSHAHSDHIGGAKSLGGKPIIIAHEETRKLLERANDPNRPLPTKTFRQRYTLNVGTQRIELSYHGNAHQPGNIFIYAPAQRTLMVIDVIFPAWMPWRRFALAQDIPGYFDQVATIERFDFDVLVSGHVARVGNKADVTLQRAFINDVKTAAHNALQGTVLGQELNPADQYNPWAVFDNYIDRVTLRCVNEVSQKWANQLAAFDVYIWDQCLAMEQSLRLD